MASASARAASGEPSFISASTDLRRSQSPINGALPRSRRRYFSSRSAFMPPPDSPLDLNIEFARLYHGHFINLNVVPEAAPEQTFQELQRPPSLRIETGA